MEFAMRGPGRIVEPLLRRVIKREARRDDQKLAVLLESDVGGRGVRFPTTVRVADLEPRFGVPRVALGCARVHRKRGWLGFRVAGRRAPARDEQVREAMRPEFLDRIERSCCSRSSALRSCRRSSG